MAVEVAVTSSIFMDEVIGLLHDNFFNLEEVRFDAAAAEVRIPFVYRERQLLKGGWLFPRSRRVEASGLLTIGHASALAIHDTERVRDYDFNVLRYEAGIITVDTGIPLGLQVEVTQPDIRVRVEDPAVS